jgi:hypothetical protein
VIVAGLVLTANLLRGPGSDGDGPRGPATASTASPLPDGTTTWTFSGEDDGVPWTLEARRFPSGQVEIAARSGGVGASFSNPSHDRVFLTSASGGGSAVRVFVGSTPPSATSARVTLPDGSIRPLDVVGDGEGIGARLFAFTLPADAGARAVVEAFAADGSSLGTSDD